MTMENVDKFYNALASDPSLKEQFIHAAQNHSFDQMDQAAAAAVAEQFVVKYAAQAGYDFTVEDLRNYGSAVGSQSAQTHLSDDELDQVTGGGLTLVCVVLGFGNATCIIGGVLGTKHGAVGCALSGVGIMSE